MYRSFAVFLDSGHIPAKYAISGLIPAKYDISGPKNMPFPAKYAISGPISGRYDRFPVLSNKNRKIRP
jgi:hypothetical protein